MSTEIETPYDIIIEDLERRVYVPRSLAADELKLYRRYRRLWLAGYAAGNEACHVENMGDNL